MVLFALFAPPIDMPVMVAAPVGALLMAICPWPDNVAERLAVLMLSGFTVVPMPLAAAKVTVVAPVISLVPVVLVLPMLPAVEVSETVLALLMLLALI